MELATELCIPKKSRKRVFPGSSSSMESKSSSQCKNKILKQTEGVIIPSAMNEIIEIDSEDDVPVDSCSDDSKDEHSDFKKMKSKSTSATGFVQSTHTDHSSGRNKGIKISGSLQKGVMKVRSVKKLLKPRFLKLSSGPRESSSTNPNPVVQDHQGETVPMEDVTFNQDSRRISSREKALRKYRYFKKFDCVEDHSDHHYSSRSSASSQITSNWAKKIQEEWRILKKHLPDTIFVRVYESRTDLLRAVIMGAEGTPYENGLFFFDVYFPKDYPHVPPEVHYHSGGLRINPNLYNNGRVCLSLLNTWMGNKNETWRPGNSTMLQVLVSIQGLILNAQPYFNEPGHSKHSGTTDGEKRSILYNEQVIVLSLKTMVYTMKRPPKYFEDLVVGHFRERAHRILTTCKGYYSSAEEKGSQGFKNDVESHMKMLVGAFKEVGVVENMDAFNPPSKNFAQKIRAFFGI